MNGQKVIFFHIYFPYFSAPRSRGGFGIFGHIELFERMNTMKLKANHNLLLPDGRTTVKIGEEFDYKGDITPFKECVTVLSLDKEADKEPAKDPVSPEEEAALREKGRLLGIKSYHNKNIEKLKAEIEEKEAEQSTPAPTPETAPASTPAHVEDEPDKKPEGEENV